MSRLEPLARLRRATLRAALRGSLVLSTTLLALGASGCDAQRASREPVQLDLPKNLGKRVPSPERNPLTQPGIALGKRLFFDPILSGNNQIACGTCHVPALAFSDGKVRSVGASGKPLLRSTPALINLAFMDGYFWDGGAKDLESQVFGPLTSPDEMGQSPADLVVELSVHPTYVKAFAEAFSDGLTIANIVRAIAQYERSLVSASSRYDHFVRNEPGGDLDPEERLGMARFSARCASCHVPDFFTDFGYHNNGLDDAYPEQDERVAWGRGRITHAPSDIGKYKTPTLRSVALTAPYMHDGRFATLRDVLDHYRHGVKPSKTLDPLLAGPAEPMDDAEARAIVAFLGTLTDDALAPAVRAPSAP